MPFSHFSRKSHRITRRAALKGLAAGAAAATALGRWAGGQTSPGTSIPPSSAGLSRPDGNLVEQLPNGAEVWQVTTTPAEQSNIYCEIAYCSRDCRYFLYERMNPQLAGDQMELIAVELGTWKQFPLDVARTTLGSAISHDGIFYYLKRSEKTLDLMRADLATGLKQCVYQRPKGPWIRSLGTVSPDGRYYAGGIALDAEWSVFGIVQVDLQKGEETILDRDPFLTNPHPQFEPGEGKCLLVQHNRGGRVSPDGKVHRLTGPEGATLYLLSVADGRRTELAVGTPYTTAVTGHEAWIGRTQGVLLTVDARGNFAPDRGNLLAVGAGRPARAVSSGCWFNHLGVSRCGRMFCCDDWQRPYNLVIGSIATGRSAVVCASNTTLGRGQEGHPHAYLTPDLRWVIFNATRNGAAHVYAARVPEGMVAGLQA